MSYTAHIDTFARDNLPPRDRWPELRFTLPELQYPARLNCVTHFLDRAKRACEERHIRIELRCVQERRDRAERMADGLRPERRRDIPVVPVGVTDERGALPVRPVRRVAH